MASGPLLAYQLCAVSKARYHLVTVGDKTSNSEFWGTSCMSQRRKLTGFAEEGTLPMSTTSLKAFAWSKQAWPQGVSQPQDSRGGSIITEHSITGVFTVMHLVIYENHFGRSARQNSRQKCGKTLTVNNIYMTSWAFWGHFVQGQDSTFTWSQIWRLLQKTAVSAPATQKQLVRIDRSNTHPCPEFELHQPYLVPSLVTSDKLRHCPIWIQSIPFL